MNRVITISRQYGSGGRELGEKLAARLGIPFYDKELLELFKATADIGVVGVHCELGDEVNSRVARLLAEGKTGRVIQQELFIAEGTFKAHTRHIYEKMGINSRKELFELLGLRS